MKKKSPRPKSDKIREMAVQETANYFGKSSDYVRKIIRGDVEQEEMNRYYNTAYAALKKTIVSINATIA